MEKIYFGGYTRKDNTGIHIYEIESGDEKIEIKKVQTIEEQSPTYLAKDDEEGMLFSITAKDGGGVSSYILDGGKYILADSLTGMGKSPCHLYWDREKRLIYASNYHLGRLDVIKVDGLGKLEAVHREQFSGKSIVSPDQDSSKCHMAIKDKDDRYLAVVDLGDDALHTYEVEESGRLIHKAVYRTEKGMGPRHIAFGKDGGEAYLIGELNSRIDVLKYEKSEGRFVYRDSVSTLPEGFNGVNTASAIKVTSDGKYLYGTNRGHDSIAVFKILEDGNLERIQIVKTGGQTPRDFGFDREENLVFIGHQNSPEITVFKRDRVTGRLKQTDASIAESEIVCVIE